MPKVAGVDRVIAAGGGDSGAGLVLLRGAGGVGKTVLARQVAGDVRVWAEFTDGIIMLRRSLVSLNPIEAMEQLVKTLARFPSNKEFLAKIRSIL